MEPIIKVENLSKDFVSQNRIKKTVLKNVSFQVYQGETVGIVGESGGGKSTLARLIAGLIKPTSGSINVNGEVQMVFQNPMESFNPRKTIGYSVTEGLRNKGISKAEAKSIILDLFDKCELPSELYDKYPHQLSGGQCQRAAIVRALAQNPKILICDEATSALDVTVQKTIIQLLAKLKTERDLTIIFICHNLSLVEIFCDRKIIVENGSVHCRNELEFMDNRVYWQNRAKSYSEVNKEELSGIQHDTWSRFLISQIEECFGDRPRDTIRILDVGAGPGFISTIMAEAGFKVTAFDFSEAMLNEARLNAGSLAEDITFVRGDAMQLPFNKECFDVVLSRNLTWNLTDPTLAYRQWLSVLKPGGLMLVFDANWYSYLVDEDMRKAFVKDRENVKNNSLEDYNIGDNFDAMEQIALVMPLTKEHRPEWDVDFLNSINAGEVSSQTNIGRILYSRKEKINYSSTPLFMVRVVKGLF